MAPSKEEQERKPVLDAEGKPLRVEQPGYYRGFSTMRQKSYWDAATREVVEARLKKNIEANLGKAPLKFFVEEADARLMRAVCERVVPQEDRVPARRVDVLAGVDERLSKGKIEGYRFEDMPADGEAYRIAVRALRLMAAELHDKPFEALSTREQEEILQSVHDAEPLGAKDVWGEMNIERWWQMLVSDCVSVYYAHPWAWDEIGFGGPAYPRGYMRLEEGEAEPWEVEEQRYAWAPPEDTISARPQEPSGHRSQHGQGGTH
jgi:hypothetical protein